MRRKIEVSQENIEKGERQCEERCPIALACREAGIVAPRVGGAAVRFNYKNSIHRSSSTLSSRARRFVKAFDKLGKHAVKPFNFFINIPDAEGS